MAHITERIKAIRKQAGLTMEQAAELMGYKTASSYQHYEDPTKFKQPYLRLSVAKKFIDVFVGKAKPGREPVTEQQILDITEPLEPIEARLDQSEAVLSEITTSLQTIIEVLNRTIANLDKLGEKKTRR